MDSVKKINKKKIKDRPGILEKKTHGEKILHAVVFVFFCIQALSLIVPVLWMIMSSFKGALEYMSDWGKNAFALPDNWALGFSNYKNAFKVLEIRGTDFFGMTFNSLWYSVVSTAFSVIMPALTGYVMAKYSFPGRKIIFNVAIISMVIPIVGNTASRMQILSFMQLLDSPLYVIVNALGGFGGNFLVYYGFFKVLSWSYAEAVMIDGGGHFTVFFRIMLPQAAPILLTYAIINLIGFWNEYESIILFLPSYPTLAAGLYEYQGNAIRAANFPIYFSGLIISIVPTLILFSIFSNRVMTSISIGGLKG